MPAEISHLAAQCSAIESLRARLVARRRGLDCGSTASKKSSQCLEQSVGNNVHPRHDIDVSAVVRMLAFSQTSSPCYDDAPGDFPVDVGQPKLWCLWKIVEIPAAKFSKRHDHNPLRAVFT